MPVSVRSVALFAALAAPVASAVAQPTTPVRRDSLPPLAPRELEIRGEMRVSLPSIVRPDLAGFGIAPAPVALDPRHTPREAPYVVRGLPGSSLAPPAPPELPVALLPVARRGMLEAGAGRDLARFGTAYLSIPLSLETRVTFDAAYDGHDDRSGRPGSHADAGRGRLALHTGTGTGTVDVALDARGLSRGLFGAAPFTGARDGADIGVTLGLAHDTPARRLALDAWARGAAFDPDGTGNTGFRSQDRHAGGRLAADLRQLGTNTALGLALDAGVEGGETSTEASSQRMFASDAGLTLSFDLGRGGVVRGGPRVLVGDDGTRRVAPTAALDLRLPLSPGLTTLASNTPVARAGRFADLVFAEPFVAPRTSPGVTVRPIDARVGVSLTQGAAVATVWGGYRYATRDAVWSQSAPGALVDVLYGAISEPVAGLDVQVTPRRSAWAGLLGLRASLETREPTFDDGTTRGDAPGRGRLAGALGVWGRVGPVTMGLTAEGESVRPADLAGTRTVPAWADLDAYVSASVTPLVAVVVRLDNLAATRRWDGFPESDKLGQIGLSIRW